MTAEELWREFCAKEGIDENIHYEAWAFCGGGPAADELAELVVKGIKFGTASAYDDYVFEDALQELPKAGDYSVILLDNGEAVCVVKDYDVYVREFGKVSSFHGYSEGEGERTIQAWRSIHTGAFGPDLEKNGFPLTDQSMIVCEKFGVAYIPDTETVKQLKMNGAGNVTTAGELGQELFFVEPTMRYEEEIRAYRQEMLEAGSEFDGCLSLKRMPEPQDWVDYCLEWGNPSRVLKEQGVRGTLLMCVRRSDNHIVGMIQIHHNMNDLIKNYVGHIGYSVRPSERKKGYATWMLAHVIDYCKTLGINEINISCVPENEASRRTIIANGGVYRDTVYMPEDHVDLERYLIDTK